MSDAVQKAPVQKAWRMPHTCVIIFFVVLVGWVLTLLIPVGIFDTHKVSYKDANGKEKTKTVLIPESFRYAYKAFDIPELKAKLAAFSSDDVALQAAGLDKAKVAPLVSLPDADLSAKALSDAGLGEPVVNKLWGRDVYNKRSADRRAPNVWGTDDNYGFGFLNYVFEGLVTGDKNGSAVGIVAFILVIGGAFGIIMKTGAVVFGMSEECLAFATVVVTFVASQVGNAASWMNPFGVAIAQGIAGVPVLSGAGFRMIMWALVTFCGAAFVMWYGQRVKKNPQLSLSYESDAFFRDHEVKNGQASASSPSSRA